MNLILVWLAAVQQKEELFPKRLDVKVPHISTDPSVRYDWDIVYVRAKRAGDTVHKRFYTDIASPLFLEAGADLMLLHPDGSEELLVEGGEGAVTDPIVSFDGEWVYYTLIHTVKGAGQFSPPKKGADIYKIHVKSKRIDRLTNQEWSPNATFSKPGYGVFNMGPCPLPTGRIAFTSNRNGFRPPRGYPPVALQLFVMDDDGRNVEQIGFLNIAGALHPVVLTDGRIMFSSLESQGARSDILWGIWTIHPDGTSWAPLVSAFDPGGAPNAFHFQTQLSDGSIVVEEYYNQNNSGFGTYIKLPPQAADPAFGPAHMASNKPWRFGRHDNAKARWYRMPFMPIGSEAMTPFVHAHDGPSDTSVPGDKNSPRVGKFTHPSGAPDNHLLTIWSPGPTNHQYTYLPQLDGGIYLIKGGKTISEPAEMLLIKNDPNYNESWPRALVSYKRIYGIDEPRRIPPFQNPTGTPFGFVGTSSLYKRESYPNGKVPEGGVTAAYAGGKDPWKGLDAFTSHGVGMPINWHNQGADSGLYSNSDIHAIRILVMEPTTLRGFYSHARERLRILGEIPVRKFGAGGQPKDPDGNPDTSFLAKIPADTAFTFQTIDRNGMLLNMAQTWHQVRPGETRANCGGCHAHSQKPTLFEETEAAKPSYKLFDLTLRTPIVTSKARDESGRKWDADDLTGLRYEKKVLDVGYRRDIQPILARACCTCHSSRTKTEGNLDLDADGELVPYESHGKFPGTYFRLALDNHAKFGHKPVGWDSWGSLQASRYVRKFQSRRSLLVWKIFGRRLDGFANDDHPRESEPGSGKLVWHGQEVDVQKNKSLAEIAYAGNICPPGGLPDEDKRTIVRWIDLGCPIDLDPKTGWFCDENRPILTVTVKEDRVLVGMYDYYSGLDMDSFTFRIDGGENLAAKFVPEGTGVWALPGRLQPGRIEALVKDKAGNLSRVVRESGR